MLQVVKDRLSESKNAYVVPKSTQDLIPIQAVCSDDGIFKVDNRYTKSYKITDINYRMAGYSQRQLICEKWYDIINSLDSEAIYQITIMNHPSHVEDVDDGVFIDTDRISNNKMLVQTATDFNSLIERKISEGNGILQDKYITVSIYKENYEDVKLFFNRLTEDLTSSMEEIGSALAPMTTNERLFILHDFYNRGDEYRPLLDYKSPYFGSDFKNFVAPNHILRKKDHLIIDDNKYVRAFYLVTYPNVLKDSFIDAITDIANNMVLSVSIIPVPIIEAKRLVRMKSGFADTEVEGWKEKQKNPTALPPARMLNRQDGARAWDDDLNLNDENMLLACITIVLSEDSKDVLDKKTDSLRSTVKSISGSNAKLEIATIQQQSVLNTCLPYGTWQVPQIRPLNTSSLAVLTPFKCLDIQEKGGIHIGENAVSKNPILLNFEAQKQLLNLSCLTTGKPGGGKSMLIKWLQLQRIMKTDNKYIIVDPEGEYSALFSTLCPELCTIVNVASGKEKINCMEIVEGYGIDDGSANSSPIGVKSSFIMSLLNRADPNHPISLEEKSILDRAVRITYEDASRNREMPTLQTLKNVVLQQEEAASKQLALKLELFTDGSLNQFGVESNVDIYNSRIIIFNLFGMNELLWPVALFVITDTIINMVTENWRHGDLTYIDFDEAQLLLGDPNTANFFDKAYRQWRKRSGIPNAITQNAKVFDEVLDQSNMLSNAEILFLMPQDESDLEIIRRRVALSEDHYEWLKRSRKGFGVLKYGDLIVPFSNVINEHSLIYRLLSTKRNEGVFGSNENY